MAKRFTDKLKEKCGVGAKKRPCGRSRKNAADWRGRRGEAAWGRGIARKKAPAAEPPKLIGMWAEIYDDTDVCRVLSMRKRRIVAMRKTAPRGEGWDVIGLHVGFTGEWIRKMAAVSKEGWLEWAATNGLKRIEPNDGIVTVELRQRYANAQVAGVAIVATGRMEVCRVRDSRMMTLGEQFDCRRSDGRLYLVESLNTERY